MQNSTVNQVSASVHFPQKRGPHSSERRRQESVRKFIRDLPYQSVSVEPDTATDQLKRSPSVAKVAWRWLRRRVSRAMRELAIELRHRKALRQIRRLDARLREDIGLQEAELFDALTGRAGRGSRYLEY